MSLSQLPVYRGKNVVAVDNNVISEYFLETPRPLVTTLFTDPAIQIWTAGRQVIDEALNHPTMNVGSRRLIWERLGELQAQGKFVISGTTHLTAPLRQTYQDLQALLSRSGLSNPDAFVVADSMTKAMPLFTLERRLPLGLQNSLRNQQVERFLRDHRLPTASRIIDLQPSGALILYPDVAPFSTYRNAA